jgi:exodeoxyribonuclease III
MKIATWNLNSIRARKDRLLAWLEANRPEVVCLQEIKVVDDDFPTEELAALGYQAVVHGQKTYNGVAILALTAPADPAIGLDDGVDDPQARLVAATVGDLRVVNVYVPNGQSPGTDKYAYKLAWLARLRTWLAERCDPAQPLVLCGDFNVAPDDRDVHDPAAWAGKIMCTEPEREALSEVVRWGLVDAYRLHHDEGGKFTWWDYRRLAFPRGEGLRIDHVFVTEALAGRCTAAEIDREARKGKQPSDHAPVVIELG